MNQFSAPSRFEITAARSKSGKTFIEDSFFTSPFKIMKPFEKEDGGISVFLQSASPGILAGDIQEHKINVKKGAKLEIRGQSFEKIFKMKENQKAERKIFGKVEDEATLIYSPLPCIPFSQSNFSSTTEINISKSSRLIYEDCICAGRCACGEVFDFTLYKNLIKIYREEKLIFCDNAFFEGSCGGKNLKAKELLQSPSMFGRFTHCGSLFLFGYEKSVLEIRRILNLEEKLLYTEDLISRFNKPGQVLIEASETDFGDIVVRALGNSAENIQRIFERVKELVR
ncbi:urease accessory protein UreD [Treponema sp.]|uniref:urease accessory protein UreD n=1 Tax=Treponema sp. TaxID=166 RepID=UPI0038901B9F